DSEVGFASNYNLFWLTGGGRLAFWENRSFTARSDWAYEVGFDQESITADPQFIDFNGADGILGYSRAAVGAAAVVDDGEPGFSTVGSWTIRDSGTIVATAFGSDFRETPALGDGSDLARWTFSGLADGTYQVVATWPNGSGTLGSSGGTYTLYDGV